MHACRGRQLRAQNAPVQGYGLIPAPGCSDQDPDAYGDSDCEQGALLGLNGDPLQRVAADPRSDLECLVAEIRRLVDRDTLAATESINDLVQYWPDHVRNLISSRSRAGGRAPAGAFAKFAEFRFNGAQMVGDRGDARVKFR
jgi:hypothetical protein